MNNNNYISMETFETMTEQQKQQYLQSNPGFQAKIN